VVLIRDEVVSARPARTPVKSLFTGHKARRTDVAVDAGRLPGTRQVVTETPLSSGPALHVMAVYAIGKVHMDE